ncbi:MAG: (d)CMP kinase, partial [Eubacteriales bacterium]
NGSDVSDEIRTPRMSAIASAISAQPVVREYLLDLQRNMARTHNVIMDGRDIGTVVLPRAKVKIFLTASAEKRAERRFLELEAKGEKTSLKQVLADMEKRDTADSTRKIAPLKPAKDAILLDTSDLDIEQSIEAILNIIAEKVK